MKHLISVNDFRRDEVDALFAKAHEISQNGRSFADALRGRVVLTMFFEPSTRTRLSFESAALRLGAGVTGFSEPKATSASKGETLEDTVRMCEAYGDVLVLRHPEELSAKRAAAISKVPIVNAGDGANEHPTQSLVDLFTIQSLRGSIDGVRIGFVGDLRYGRTVHSLLGALALYRNVEVQCFAPPSLALPIAHKNRAIERGLRVHEGASLRDVVQSVDILYVTRIQRERFIAGEDASTDAYRITPETLEQAPASLRILHPLPRVDEIAESVDASPHAAYFAQAANGVPVRQAVLLDALGVR